MLDAETKRRIDTCRNILVGKVPDPKSQVEQITIALIYKFMDDMDAEAEELGGARSFFTGDHAKYGWARLMAPNMGGFDMLALYSEAIGKMNENPGVPPLFRDIFKNAYLPYRDPETLRSFLKEIDGFTYDHSERLGDAFEYLLSVLGSQGDAGQFRTPRHIIDFMVEIIDPKKNESVLDPACGTAGFLISAWKHVLKQNTKERPGDKLTPEERANLVANIRGYDISPDMVRLSLVNLYLHGFTDPHIVEYDTLTSEERWNESADIILANPPFMSPKGGIKPHKRFTVQATRSEVLFVDYIAEHLSPQGRAAIVVPEGIIFQSGTAYRKLREMLVKTSLVAVVSLPAGVFNPYSGVKTSILILDRRLAKTSDSVLFVKIGNDGFNLGAQRRAVAGSELPEAARVLREWMHGRFDDNSALATRVERARIGENGEWNLSGDRYQTAPDIQTTFKAAPIGELVTTITPPAKLQKERYADEGRYPIIDQSQQEIAGWTDDERAVICPAKPLVIFGDHTCAVKLVKRPFAQGADGIKILETSEQLLPEFLFYFLKFHPLASDGYKRHFTDLKRKTIPLPPLEIQQEIIAEIESYQKIIDGARQVVENYRPRINAIPEWPLCSIAEIAEVNPKKSQLVISDNSLPVSFVPMSELPENEMFFQAKEVKPICEVLKQYTYFQDDDVLLAKVTPCFENGKAGIARNLVNGLGFGSSEYYVIRANKQRVLPEWIYLHVATSSFREHGTNRMTGTGGLQRVPRDVLNEWRIPVPRSIEKQQALVDDLYAEQTLINTNKQLIARFEAKIKAVIDRVWRGGERDREAA